MENNELNKDWQNGQDKGQYKPKDYEKMEYEPKQKIEDESQMSTVEQTKLENAYTLWIMINDTNFKNKNKGKDFDSNQLQEISSFQSVEEFFMVYQHLRRPTAMPYFTFLHIFKKGIKPVWEDPAFKEGSRFQIKTQKSHTSKYWEDLLLAMMGEQFQSNDNIGGMVLNLKPNFDKIAIWVTNSQDKEAVNQIRADIVKFLQIEDIEIEYDIFKEIMEKNKNAPRANFNKRGGRGRGGRGGRGGEYSYNNDFNRAEFKKTE